MVLPNNPAVIHPFIPAVLQTLVPVSGFDINGIRASYDSTTDTLSVGIDQPPAYSGSPYSVIAGDADDNGNDGTTNPAVQAQPGQGGFTDFPDFGGSEYMGVFLDLGGSSTPSVEAGYSQGDTRSPKQYQVAQAAVNSSGQPSPVFGTELPQFEGNVYKVNSPVHPNLEFDITHFSQLYLQETGQPLTATSQIGIGGLAGSNADGGIGEAFFPAQTFTLSQATPPVHVCPPASPPVVINPHQNRHVNTAHPELVRVTVQGSSGFDVTKIDPASVTLGGAHPLFAFTRRVLTNGFLAETFVFDGDQIQLPPGITTATVTGNLTDGSTFVTSEQVFNRNYSFYSPGQQAQQQARWAARGSDIPDLPSIIARYERNQNSAVIFTYTGGGVTPGSGTATPAATPAVATPSAGPSVRVAMRAARASQQGVTVNMGSAAGGSSATGHVVSIAQRQAAAVTAANVPNRLARSMNAYLQSNPGAASTSAT